MQDLICTFRFDGRPVRWRWRRTFQNRLGRTDDRSAAMTMLPESSVRPAGRKELESQSVAATAANQYHLPIVKSHRARHNKNPSPNSSAWVNWCEAKTLHFKRRKPRI